MIPGLEKHRRLLAPALIACMLAPLGAGIGATHASTATPRRNIVAADATPTATATAGKTVTPGTSPTPGTTPTPGAATSGKATLAVSETTITLGARFNVHGAGFKAAERVDLQIAAKGATQNGQHLRYVTAASDGAFTVVGMTLPASLKADTYSLVAIGDSSARTAYVDIVVKVPQPTIHLSAIVLRPDENVTVSGSHFSPGETVSIALGNTAGSASVPLGQATAGATGHFGPVTLKIPFGIPPGTLQIVATGQTSARQAKIAVQVHVSRPTLTVSPATARPDDAVTVQGAHFQPGEKITLDLVSLSTTTQIATVQANAAGSFTASGVKIPSNTPESTVSIVATGTSSHLNATVRIAIGAKPATLTLGSSTIEAGKTLKVGGSGFIPGETVTIQLIGGALPPVTLATAVAGTDGAFTVAALVIPTFVPSGSYTVQVSGQTSGRIAKATLAVQAPKPSGPSLSLIGAAQSGGVYKASPGALLQLAGSHFPAGATVTVALVSASTTTQIATLKVSGDGALGPLGVTVPANTPAGDYSLKILAAGKDLTSVKLAVAALTPKLIVSSGSVKPGDVVTVQGSGYAPGEQIVLALNGAALATQPSTVQTNAAGAFAARVAIPDSLTNGSNLLIATGAASRASAAAALQGHLPVATRFYFPNGDTTGGNRTLISLLNPTGGVATVDMTFLYQSAQVRRYTQTVAPHTLATVDLALVGGANQHISVIVQADRRIAAQSDLYYASGDGDAALGASGPAKSWYLAEGYTGGGFSEYLEIMNPNPSYANVDVRFLPFNNKPLNEQRFTIGPNSMIVLNTNQYMPGLSFSTIVTANQGIVVERTMHFGAAGHGTHDKIGITTASTVWSFAQSTTAGDRQTFLTVLNPNQAAPAAVTATFFDSKGRPVGTRTIIIDPLHRGNIKVNDVLPAAEVGTILTSNVPVVAEQPQYEGPANLGLARSGSDLFGRNGGSTTWAFPSGDTANGNHAYLYLFNPGLKATTLQITFYGTTGGTVQRTITLAANSRSLIDVNAVGGLPSSRYGAIVRSTDGGAFIAAQLVLDSLSHRAASSQGQAY